MGKMVNREHPVILDGECLEDLLVVLHDLQARFGGKAQLSVRADSDGYDGYDVAAYVPYTSAQTPAEIARAEEREAQVSNYERKRYEALKAKFG